MKHVARLAPLASVLFAASSMVAATAADGATIYGCVTSRGRIKSISVIQPTCRSSQTLISWNQQGPPGPPGGSPTVTDDSGTLVGILAAGPSTGPCPANVVRHENGIPVALAVTKDAIASCSATDFLHDSTNCSGTRYLALAQFDLARVAHVSGTTAYYPTDPLQTLIVRSREVLGYSSSKCTANGGAVLAGGECCLPSDATVEAGPAATLDLSGFSAPFSVD